MTFSHNGITDEEIEELKKLGESPPTKTFLEQEDRIKVCEVLSAFFSAENYPDTRHLLNDLYAVVDNARRESYPDPD
tara:strand:+ start:286 stop:516 length:231 start_codon:yes stop_codon:yes gene_type:complete